VPEVHFYHNHPDPLAAACQLVGRAYQKDRKVLLIAADPAQSRGLDQALWTYAQQSFIPHVGLDSPLAAETPVLIAVAGRHQPPWPHSDMLFNLGASIPDGFDGFRMVLEIVGPTESEKAAARQRWQNYRSLGLQPVPHDMEKGS